MLHPHLSPGITSHRAEDVLNMLITVYNEETIKDKNQIAINTPTSSTERLVIIEKELGGVENELSPYKQNNDIIDIGSAVPCPCQTNGSTAVTIQELEIAGHAWHAAHQETTWWTHPKRLELILQTPA